jgi:hypothetical protein
MFSILLPLFVFVTSGFADILSMALTTDIVKSKRLFFVMSYRKVIRLLLCETYKAGAPQILLGFHQLPSDIYNLDSIANVYKVFSRAKILARNKAAVGIHYIPSVYDITH